MVQSQLFSLWIIILMVLIQWVCDSEHTFIVMCVVVVYVVASIAILSSLDSGTHLSGYGKRVPFTAYYSTYHSVLH